MPKPKKTASKPKRLFRFRSVNANSLSELANHEIWFADASKFNDPFEFSFRILSQLKFTEADRKKGPFKGISLTEYNKIANAFVAHQAKERLSKHWAETIGACCFFDTNEKVLAWSHYADSHKGFCVEFASSDPIFKLARKITYTNNPPDASFLVNDVLQRLKGDKEGRVELLNKLGPAAKSVPPPELSKKEFQRVQEIITQIMTTKGKKWAYEKSEWRAFNKKPNSLAFHKPTSIKAIYFGGKMSDKNKRLIQKVTSNAYEYFDSKLRSDDYTIEFWQHEG